MEKKTKTPAMSALSWATGLTAGFIIFHILLALVKGQDGGVLAMKLLTGIAMFPILFFVLWVWGTFSKKESFDHNRPSLSSNWEKKCNWCGRMIEGDALICRFCQKDQ